MWCFTTTHDVRFIQRNPVNISNKNLALIVLFLVFKIHNTSVFQLVFRLLTAVFLP